METLPPVEIVVSDVGFCPVLQRGDRMLYSHPGVAGERVCAQALTTLAPAAEAVALAAAEDRAMQPLPLTCPMEGCGATFVLQVVGKDVARSFATPVPLSRHRSREAGAGPRRARAGRGRRFLKKLAFLLILVAGLAVAGFAGVAYFRPEFLPRAVAETLMAWGVTLAGAPAATPGQEPRPGTDSGTAGAAREDAPPAAPATEKPAARTPAARDPRAGGPAAAGKPDARPPDEGKPPTAPPSEAEDPAGKPPEGDRHPSDSPDGPPRSPGPPEPSPPQP